jgi:signal transduction histidine kinase/CheY-like chemotaxis protein
MSAREKSKLKNRLNNRSIAKDLTIGTMLTMVIVSTIALSINFYYVSQNAMVQVESKADDLIESMSKTLDFSLWNFDEETVKSIGASYALNDLISKLKIVDSMGVTYFETDKKSDAPLITRSNTVLHGDKPVGQVDIALTSDYYHEISRQFIISGALLIFINLISLIIIIKLLLKRFLKQPLDFFSEIVTNYGSGNYALQEKSILVKEFQPFITVLNKMGNQIAVQMDQLQKSHNDLEIRVENRTAELAKSNKELEYEISEHKRTQEEKINAQKIAGEQKKLALVGQVAGKMAHDFNNILGIIMGTAELAIMDCKNAEIKKSLKLIFDQTLRGKNLTKNLVAFAKSQEPKQNFFKINEKIDLVIDLLQKDLEAIELIKENKPGVPDLLADPGMIEHALVNLVQNSIHAVGMVKKPRIIVRSFCLDDYICFEIEDNGCGIPKDYLENIYDPSFTLKGSKDITRSYKHDIKGTGYGMSNVKKYVEQHKGIIEVESIFGSGTTFTIRLPVIKKELTKEEKIEIRKETAQFKKNVLLVEDESAILDVQYRVLTQDPCRHKVATALNGKAALDLFDKNEYDLVSLDYILPGNMNGMDVYNHIRTKDKTIPILFVSGNIDFLESIKELRQNDANIDHLSKPCQNRDYLNSINGLLEKASVS